MKGLKIWLTVSLILAVAVPSLAQRRERPEIPEREFSTPYRSDSRGGVWGISAAPNKTGSKVMTSPGKAMWTPEAPRHQSKVMRTTSKVTTTGSSAGIAGVSKALNTPSAIPVKHRQQAPANFESWEQAQEFARRYQQRRSIWDYPELPEVDENGKLIEPPTEEAGLPQIQTGELPMAREGELPMVKTGGLPMMPTTPSP